jgi:hypothetical protein
LKALPDNVSPIRSIFDMPPELAEASFGRVYEHTKNSSLVILSAHRGDRDPNDPVRNKTLNHAAHGELVDLVRQHGFGYTKVRGRTIENRDTPNERPVDEDFLMVTSSPQGHDRLIAMAKHLGRHFGWDSVLYKPHDDDNAYLLGTNKRGFVDPPFGETKVLGKFHPNKVGDYISMLRRHHRGGLASAFGESLAPEDSMRLVFLEQKSFFSRWNTPGYDDRIF